MTNLLQVGSITSEMREQLEAKFIIHQLDDFEPNEITHVITNGHDGVSPDLMASLSNLRVISGYGVGYDAIDMSRSCKARDCRHPHTKCLERRSCYNCSSIIAIQLP